MKRIRKKSVIIIALTVMALWNLFLWFIPNGPYNMRHYISLTSVGPGSTQFEQSAWFSNAFKQQFNVILHNRAFNDDKSSIEILFSKHPHALFGDHADYAITGLPGSYFAQEGLFEFGYLGAGPQPVRLLVENRAPQLRTLVVREDSGIRDIKSLRGKRIAWTQSVLETHYFMLALLRYGGVKPENVTFVPVGSPEYATQLLIKGKVDAVFSPSRQRMLNQDPSHAVALRYLPMPVNGLGWKNVQEIAPFFHAVSGTIGAGLSNKAPVKSATYPFPILLTRANMSVNDVKHFVDAFLHVAPSRVAYDANMIGWDMQGLTMDWVVPYHEGAIEVFKQKGWWNEAQQHYNDRLVERQQVLATAWKTMDQTRFVDNDAIRNAWLPIRHQALKNAGFSSGFVDPEMAKFLYKTYKHPAVAIK